MQRLPIKGYLTGDAAHMVDPAKFGRAMWARAPSGEMAPLDLHGRVSASDLRGLNRVHDRLRFYRGVHPALEVVRGHQWDSMPVIKPYLIASMENRSEARDMKSLGDWDAFWQSVN